MDKEIMSRILSQSIENDGILRFGIFSFLILNTLGTEE